MAKSDGQKKTTAHPVPAVPVQSSGEKMLLAWIAFIRTYVVLSDNQAIACALWAINSWVYDQFDSVPFLEIFGTTKRCGKSTLLKIIVSLSRGGKEFAIIRILSVLGWLEEMEGKVTICVDEAEQFSKGPIGDMRSSLANGFLKGGSHMVKRHGSAALWYRTFAPWLFACIGTVHDVLRDRCIEIMMGRGTPERKYNDERRAADQRAMGLVDDLLAVFREYGVSRSKVNHGNAQIAELVPGFKPQDTDAGIVPIVPVEWLSDRERDLWTPLYSVAVWLRLSPEMLDRVQAASIDLSREKHARPPCRFHSAQAETDADDKDMAERILRDLRASLRETETYIQTSDAVSRLRALPTAPWRVYGNGGINEQTLANMLARFGIKWRQVRLPRKAKGIEGERIQAYDTAALRAVVL